MVDPEDQAKWLRIFHSYIIDKKMEPLDAAEKIRKDYQLTDAIETSQRDVSMEDESSPQSPPEGDSAKSTQAGTTQSPPGRGRGGSNPQSADSKSPAHGEPVEPSDSLFAGIGKSIVQGTTAFPRTFWGALATAEDVVKNIPEAIPWAIVTQFAPEDFFKRRYEDVKGIEERFQAKGEGYKKYVNGAIRTMSEMLSQYIGTAGMGTLPSMAAGAGIDKYLGARKEGYSIPRSFAAGGVTATTEFVTEKTPLEILGRPGLKFVDRLMKGLIADIPGEVEATLVEMSTVDTAILGKSYTPQEYLGALLDTAATAALTTVGATGVTHPFTSRVGIAHQPPGEQAPQTPEIRQPEKEEVPGVKPEEYATARKATETQQIRQITPEEFNALPAEQSTTTSIKLTTLQDLYNQYQKNLSGKTFTTPIGKEVTLKDGHFFNLIAGKLDTDTRKGYIEKASNAEEARQLIESGKISFDDVRGFQPRRAKNISLVPDILQNPQIVMQPQNNDKKFIFLKKYKINGDQSFIVVTVDTGNDRLGVMSFHPKDVTKQFLKTHKTIWQLSDTPASESPSRGTPAGKVSPLESTNIIQPPPESVKPVVIEAELPDIQLMPPLKDLVDTAKLSLEDALEINDIATQNNWSEDTVKKFYKNAVEGLGIQNKDTASLEQMLITAKVKEAVYKQNVEQYKQEIEVNEKLIKTLYDRLNIKIEGGAPDKYETIANDFIKNLGDLKNLKPEEIVQKAQEELALNLNRLDTGMDIKTLIAATVQTINEAEGISKETVSHEQTIQEAMKELPGIYRKVLDMKRGKTLTRQQQLAARILGTALYENFNKTRLLGMADPKNTELSQKAMTQLIELGQYWSKVLASSSEMGRELEAQKIIAKVGEDIPATEEFQKILGMLQGQNEISPEQFYQLTGMLKSPDQLAEMAREMAKPVTRRIQDIFIEAWINGLLSNPQTHATNILSNLYTTFASIPERYLASKTHYGDKPGVVDGEAKAMLYGMQMGFRDAVNAARIVWATETGRFGKTAQKVENAQRKAISAENINRILAKFGVDPMNQTLSNAVDYVGKIWRLPTRALMTADEFFKMINYRMELQALAYRQAAMEGLTGDKAGEKIAELTRKPTVEMRARAIAHANIQTFTGEMGPVATAISGITERVPIAKIVVPFVRTPSNIFTYAFDRTPFLAYARSQIRADIKAGGTARDMALGKMAFGGMIAGLAATLAAAGFITGSGPEDRELKKMMRDNGWQPNSIRIGNTYYS